MSTQIACKELAGEVAALGPANHGPADAIAGGDRVDVYSGVWCGERSSYGRDAENLCRQMRTTFSVACVPPAL